MSEEGSNNNGRDSATELFDFCESESISEEGLREIIERHELMAGNDNSVDDYAFFLEACLNERVTEGVIRYLLQYFPAAASATNEEDGWTPLHFACMNKNVTKGIIQILISAAPDSVRSVTKMGSMPLHFLCQNDNVDEANATQILEVLMEKFSEAVRHVDSRGSLPIHQASVNKSLEFCHVLIEAYPGSERMTESKGGLPLNYACGLNTVTTVEYLYKRYPEAIDQAANWGGYPIHFAIQGMEHRKNPAAAVEVVQFLLECDPNVKLQKYRGQSLLHFACRLECDDSNIYAALAVIKAIYDFYPEAMEGNEIISNIENYHQDVQVFILTQLGHARQAKVHRLMTTPDTNGQLPLHKALRNDSACFGSIKLLVKGNPLALRILDNNFAFPLHIACQHHDSASVVQYLVGLDPATLDALDREGNTALHYACRGAKHGTIARCWRSMMPHRCRNGMLTASFPLICFGEAMRSVIGQALNTREASFSLCGQTPRWLQSAI